MENASSKVGQQRRASTQYIGKRPIAVGEKRGSKRSPVEREASRRSRRRAGRGCRQGCSFWFGRSGRATTDEREVRGNRTGKGKRRRLNSLNAAHQTRRGGGPKREASPAQSQGAHIKTEELFQGTRAAGGTEK